MRILSRSSAFSRVTAIAEQRKLHEAFRWLHLHEQQMMRWQMELVQIPAPPFGEAARSAWMAERFREAGLGQVEIDSIGNVFGIIAGTGFETDSEAERTGTVVLLSAHLDTVFPADTPLEPMVDGERVVAPGICDNACGVIGMLAIAHAMVQSGLQPETTLIFCGNVGEEGEGNLRGVRHIYQYSRYAGRICTHLVLDGAGTEVAVTQGLGSRRYQVRIEGPGGHSFTDAGTPNPIVAMALAMVRLEEAPLQAVGDEARATFNVGMISGGTSVNTIPELATASVEFRSTDVRPLVRLEVALYRAVEDAVELANGKFAARQGLKQVASNGSKSSVALRYSIEKIGDRPAADLPEDAPLMETIRAVDRHLGLRTDLRLGSTDANIPLSLGVQAVSLGAGGEGGGAHTRSEWYSARGRELGLRRVLLIALAMLDWASARSQATPG
jgi:tripeptide aminopeptidase